MPRRLVIKVGKSFVEHHCSRSPSIYACWHYHLFLRYLRLAEVSESQIVNQVNAALRTEVAKFIFRIILLSGLILPNTLKGYSLEP